MTNAATTPDPTPGKLTYSAVPIDLGSKNTGAVNVRSDIIGYFNVPTAATSLTPVLKTRAAYTYSKKNGLGDATGTPKTVEKSEWYDLPTAPRRGTGKSIRIPTELKTDKGTLRFITLRFPSGATNLAISNWIAEYFKAHTPSYFITPSGTRYPVSDVTLADLNPGNANADAAPAA
jgi:hypothetical protein